MIKKFLLNYEEELLSKKIDLSKALQKLEMSLKENVEFIHFIEESEDKLYDSFSPNNYKSDSNNKKIKELKERQKVLKKERDELDLKLKNTTEKILELQTIIQQVNQENENLKNLEGQVIENEDVRMEILSTREYERQRIARDLHDSTVQSLASMIHKIELCNRLMDMDSNRCKLELQNLSKVVKDTIRDMREIIYNLRPMSLDDIGFDVTIEQELDRLRNNSDINIEFVKNGNLSTINSVVGLTIFRIVQEACNNTIKHAGAKNIFIEINYNNDKMIVDIEDDGKGFEIGKAKRDTNKNTGFGLSIMHERIYLLSGNIDIKSKINEGTKIHIEIPMKEDVLCL